MLTVAPAGYTIQRVDLATADKALMDQVVDLVHAIDREAVPEDPPLPREIVEARFRVSSKLWDRSQWAAFADGQLAGRVTVVQNKSGSNEDKRDVEIQVHPMHRRRGLGRALFATGVGAIPSPAAGASLAGGADGAARLVQWWTTTRVPAGMEFSKRVGAKAGLHMRASQLDLAKIDRALMKEWAAIDPPGYRLEWVVGDIPDGLMKQALEAFNAINRMPREDLEMEDWKFTEETTREWERTRKERGLESYLVLAIEDATGAAAGFTDVVFDRRYLHVIHQGGTAVDKAHQGKGIGKWMKASMANKVLADMPQARFIRTDNAGTNAPMLAINDRMGFREAWWMDIWQMPLADAKAYGR